MNTHKNKILVLTDLRQSATTTLQNTLGLAQKMDAEVELFHVKNPLEIIQTENQLLAMRSLSRAHNSTQKSFDALIHQIDESQVEVGYSFVFGRLKQEIGKKIEQYQPDLIVVGKRTKNPLKLSRDRLTNYLIKTTSCPVFIASDSNRLTTDSTLVPAFYNNSSSMFSNFMALNKLNNETDRLREFKIVTKTQNESDIESTSSSDHVEYVFEKSDNAIKTLSSYLTKNNVNLFCVQWEHRLSRDLKALINHVDVPLLIAAKHKA